MKTIILLAIFIFTLTVRGDDETESQSTSADSEDECENENEEMGCLMPKACWNTCENRDNSVQCEAPCKPGCDCIPGFVRDSNGNCIDPEICPKDEPCPPHQEIGCGSPCNSNRCENTYYNGPPKFCIALCIIQCVCVKGWALKSSEENFCIPIEECPICCPGNREFKECGPYNPRSCDDPNAEEVIDEENCNRGCFCKDGLVEDGFGNCIPPDNCPLLCGSNEIEDACANPCQPTCQNPHPPVCQFLVCNKRCVCRPPYIRDEATNQCVDMKDCTK